jgi:hypothetical protein
VNVPPFGPLAVAWADPDPTDDPAPGTDVAVETVPLDDATGGATVVGVAPVLPCDAPPQAVRASATATSISRGKRMPPRAGLMRYPIGAQLRRLRRTDLSLTETPEIRDFCPAGAETMPIVLGLPGTS